MAAQTLSDSLINICIVPKRVRWPDPSSAPAWAKAHDCVAAFKDLIRNVDLDCLQVEQSKEFSSDAIRRRRATLCDKAMTKLASFKTFEVAEKGLVANIDSLERLTDPDPEQAQMHGKLKQALRDLREGVGATRRMLQERCKVDQGASV